MKYKIRNNLPIVRAPCKRLCGRILDPQATQEQVKRRLETEEGGREQGREVLRKMQIDSEVHTTNAQICVESVGIMYPQGIHDRLQEGKAIEVAQEQIWTHRKGKLLVPRTVTFVVPRWILST